MGQRKGQGKGGRGQRKSALKQEGIFWELQVERGISGVGEGGQG